MEKIISTMPGPKGLPIFGVLIRTIVENGVEELMKLNDEFGSPAKFWFGPLNLVVVTEAPNDIKAIFTSENCLDKASFYEFLRMGDGLFVTKKEKWRPHRKVLTPAFNVNMIKLFLPIFNKKSNELISDLRKNVNKQEFDIIEYLTMCALETILETMLNIDADDIGKKTKSEYIRNSQRLSFINYNKLTLFKMIIWMFE